VTRFQIAHISDLHFAVEEARGNAFTEHNHVELILGFSNRYLPSSFTGRKAIILADLLVDLKDEIDALLITGDLATTGDIQDLEAAKDWIVGNASTKYIPALRGFAPVPNTVRRIGDVKPFVIIPGNHDRFLGRKNEPGSTSFETVFGTYWDLDSGFVDQTCPFPAIRKTTLRSRASANSTEKLTFLCADLALRAKHDDQGTWGYLGQGRAYSDICTDLVDETRHCRSEDSLNCVVWVIHFPPRFEHPKVGNRLRLLGEDLLLDSADSVDVKLVFTGHTHLADVYKARKSRAVVVCAGTPIAFGKGEEHSFNLATLDVDQGCLVDAKVVHWAFNSTEKTFKADKSIPIPF
jgi:3',5'-cyclic AMP phosphodiesterase CpdA